VTSCALRWVLAVAIFVVAVESHARDPGRDHDQAARDAVAELLRELHYDGPPPAITWVSAHEVVEVCGCTVGADRRWAIYRKNTAYLSRALNLADPFDRSVLLHELVHHIQWIASGPAADCYEWHRREVLAHAAQNAWLMDHGSGQRVIFIGTCR